VTKEEVVETNSMRDVISQYGLVANRSGFVKCPFHTGDKTPSLKIYDKSFHCFGCGASGDIFKFVQLMDNVNFREAFLSLGGTYEKMNFSDKLKIYQYHQNMLMQRKTNDRLRDVLNFNIELIGIYRKLLQRSEPFSQVWTDSYNFLQYQIYRNTDITDVEARW